MPNYQRGEVYKFRKNSERDTHHSPCTQLEESARHFFVVAYPTATGCVGFMLTTKLVTNNERLPSEYFEGGTFKEGEEGTYFLRVPLSKTPELDVRIRSNLTEKAVAYIESRAITKRPNSWKQYVSKVCGERKGRYYIKQYPLSADDDTV